MKITTTMEAITPAMAETILQEHYNRVANGEYSQRNIYKTIVMKYVTDMRNGHWKPSPSPIIFDEDGNLANGQHRLEGVRQSGKTIEFTITRGWPKDVIDTEDRGKSRTVGDQLYLHGVKNANVVASSVTGIVRVCYRGGAPAISYATAEYILNDLDMRKRIELILSVFMPIQGSKNMKSGRIVGPLAFYHTVAPKKAIEFAEGIANLEMERNSGNQLYARYIRGRSPDSQEIAIRAACSAIRLWDENETAEHMKPTYQAIEWLAARNKKLSGTITDMLGLISTGVPKEKK